MKSPLRTPVSTRVNATKLAMHFGVTVTHVRRLAKEAIIALESDGKYDQDRSRLAYITHLRSQRNIKAEGDASYRKLKNRKLQIEIAKMNGSLIDLEECVTLTEQLVGSFRAALSGLSARITSDIVLRGQIDAACDEMLTRLSDDFEKKSKALQDGQSLIEVEAAVETDDQDDE